MPPADLNLDSSPSTEPGRVVSRPTALGFRLVVYPPHDAPFDYYGMGPTVMGRCTSADVCIHDPRMSRRHATIGRRRDGSFDLRDLESRNGTFINGCRQSESALLPNDVLRFGDTLAVFEVGPFDRAQCRWDRSMHQVMLELEAAHAASLDVPVLLLGPTGAGKSWLAGRIAEQSDRATPFIHVNCGALPAALVEAELFGATKGAYTGAHEERPGLIGAASGGTLFLDEISTLQLELQSKLLVFLDTSCVRRVGSARDTKVDVRIIAASNSDLKHAVERGEFREDLLYRLSAKTIVMKPLSARRVEIAALAAQVLGALDHRAFTPEALEALLTAPWRGNVRELRDLMMILARRTTPIDYHALPSEFTHAVVERNGESTPIRPSREALEAILAEHDWNVTHTARAMGKHRTQIQRWIRAFRLRREP